MSSAQVSARNHDTSAPTSYRSPSYRMAPCRLPSHRLPSCGIRSYEITFHTGASLQKVIITSQGVMAARLQ